MLVGLLTSVAAAAQTRLAMDQIGTHPQQAGTRISLTQAASLGQSQMPNKCTAFWYPMTTCAEPLSKTDCVDAHQPVTIPLMVCLLQPK